MNRVFVWQFGAEGWRRFIVLNTAFDVWTGDSWNSERMAALLYHDLDEAECVAAELSARIRRRVFKTTVSVAVECAEDFSLDELRAYLGLHAEVVLDRAEDASVLDAAWIDFDGEWGLLQED